HDYIDKKQIKPLIITLSHALEQLGLPVINRYNYRVNTPQEISGRFWLVGFVEDRNTTNSTITMAKIENGRPAISVLLLPAISSAYCAAGGYRAYQFALNKKVLLKKHPFRTENSVNKPAEDESALRIVKGEKSPNLRSEDYVKT
ncbi:MAG: hypothetical protein ACTJFN_14375, partial [Sphingobacterium sp.]